MADVTVDEMVDEMVDEIATCGTDLQTAEPVSEIGVAKMGGIATNPLV